MNLTEEFVNVVKENFGEQHGQFISAAVALIRSESKGFGDEMPLNWDERLNREMAKKTYKERLILAGALIAAEIDRLQKPG